MRSPFEVCPVPFFSPLFSLTDQYDISVSPCLDVSSKSHGSDFLIFCPVSSVQICLLQPGIEVIQCRLDGTDKSLIDTKRDREEPLHNPISQTFHARNTLIYMVMNFEILGSTEAPWVAIALPGIQWQLSNQA